MTFERNHKRTSPRTKRNARRRRNPRSIIYLILGVLVLLSPVVITHLKNIEQHEIAQLYSENVKKMTPDQRKQLLEAAQKYNKELPEVGSPDPWVNGIDVNTPAYMRYLAQLDVESVMGRLKVPAVGIDLPIYHGTSQSTLAHGIGHLYGTALPTGGVGFHSVLTGHSGLATLTMFDNLTHIEVGEIFIVEILGEQHAYKVDQIKVVLPQDVESIRPESGRDLVTLVTCTPYGINSHRLLVRGERVEMPKENIEQVYSSPWQPWMIAAIVISVLTLLYILWWLFGRKRKRDEEDEQQNLTEQLEEVEDAQQ
ncbi:class C sortase [Arcanobacterium bovis]|uniref:Class C sortase n=1 Tax=Arcanobacterium bovis TaxID=2529275 RepID=A0A4V2KR23_9ACTO|nr:class C sortase [Arcanobacterium bovis]TBW21508.1 class C sortase [Arcanobacterium bovis]